MNFRKNLTIAATTLAVLLIVYGAVFCLTADRSQDDEVVIYSMDPESITQFDFTGGGMPVSLVRREDTWYWSEDASFPLNQSFVETMLEKTGTLRAKRLVEKSPSDLSGYGLDHPSNALRITAKERSVSIRIGHEISTSGDYYMMVEGGSVYTVDQTFANIFSNGLYTMAVRQTLPNMIMTGIENVQITDSTGILRLSAADDVTQTGACVDWTVTEDAGAAQFADTTAVQSLISGIPALRYDAMVAYKPSQEQLKKFGLSGSARSLWIRYLPEGGMQIEEFTLTVGGTDAENADYYVAPSNSDAVYTADRGSIDAFFGHSAREYLTLSVAPIKPDELASLFVTCGSGRFDFTVDRADAGITCRCNGEQIQEIAFNTFYYQLYALDAEKRLDQDKSALLSGKEPMMSLTYTRGSGNGEAVQVEIYDYDASYDLACVNGSAELLLNKQRVNALENALEDFPQ